MHSILKLSVALFAALAPIMSEAQSTKEHDLESSGSYAGACSGWTGPREAVPINFEVLLELSLLFNEPVIRSSMTWRKQPWTSACIFPYGSKDIVEVPVPAELDPDNKARPYNFEFVAELSSSAMGARSVYLRFNPGALAEVPGEDSYNTPGARNWDRMFFTMSSNVTGFAAYGDEESYSFLDAETAKEVFSGDLTISQLHVVKADFDLTAMKTNYAKLLRDQKVINNTVARLADWGEASIEDYPAQLRALIETNAALDPAKSIEAQTRLIGEIRSFHGSVAGGISEQANVELEEIDRGLDIFLAEMAAGDNGSGLYQSLHAGTLTSAAQEQAAIDLAKSKLLAEIDENRLPVGGEVFTFVKFYIDFDTSHIVHVCGRTVAKNGELAYYDAKPYQSISAWAAFRLSFDAEDVSYLHLEDKSKYGNSVPDSPIIARMADEIYASNAFQRARQTEYKQGISSAMRNTETGEGYWAFEGQITVLSEQVRYSDLEAHFCGGALLEQKRSYGFKVETLILGEY